jgi:hypothetical protein
MFEFAVPPTLFRLLYATHTRGPRDLRYAYPNSTGTHRYVPLTNNDQKNSRQPETLEFGRKLAGTRERASCTVYGKLVFLLTRDVSFFFCWSLTRPQGTVAPLRYLPSKILIRTTC